MSQKALRCIAMGVQANVPLLTVGGPGIGKTSGIVAPLLAPPCPLLANASVGTRSATTAAIARTLRIASPLV